ncbi:L,D-transpeptidase [Prosthecomicrobium sp. N25]|uniref:L,D-transpeptidase n=1 Tax=Prosthecomicrobium sp. N25 TaxID=3129254 RepID=UPI0030781700
MRAGMTAAVTLAAGLLAAVTVVKAEYNPGVQVRYDAMGNAVEGPGITPTTSSSAGPRYTPIPREVVDFKGPNLGRGNILINTAERRLYLMLGDGKALKYGIGVGRPGFTWGGTHSVTRKAEWPGWTPPPQMRKRVPNLPAYMPGGPDNPLGARAMYLGSTFYRIHGSNEPWSIGQAVSSGCFRMTNDDVTDLYERVKVGARVTVVHD